MAEIIFDAFNPTDACRQAPPRSQQTDNCRIEAKFHVRGDSTPSRAGLAFKRERDRFVLETVGNESLTALVRGLGFSETNPVLQGNLFYSVALHDWVKRNYENLNRQQRQDIPWFLPSLEALRNFVVVGSIENPDPEQKKANEELLHQLFQLPPRGQKYILKAIRVLQTVHQSLILSTMRPRIHWLDDLTKTYQQLKPELSALKPGDPVRQQIQQWSTRLLIYLGTGTGQFAELQKELDGIVLQLAKQNSKLPILFEDLYGFFLNKLEPLSQNVYFSKNPEGKGRLRDTLFFLRESFEDRRSELLFFSNRSNLAQDIFSRSVLLRLNKATRSGDLAQLVRDEAERSRVRLDWLSKRENLELIHEAVASSLIWHSGRDGNGHASLNVEKLQAKLAATFKGRSIQRRNLLVGTLASLRYVFGRDARALTLSAWVRDKYAPVSIELHPEEKSRLQDLIRKLERDIDRSSRRSETYLPWIEGGICAAGLGLGGAGIGIHQRELTVSGSTVTGLGCGSLLSHFIFRKRNHYIVDTIGGALGAGAGFGLSWFLTRSGTKGHGMPPLPHPDPGRRNPTDPFGP